MILTCLAALMKLLDDTGVTSFETDTTFRRVAGDFNEWEVVLFLKALQRGESSQCSPCSFVIETVSPVLQPLQSHEPTSIGPVPSSTNAFTTNFKRSN